MPPEGLRFSGYDAIYNKPVDLPVPDLLPTDAASNSEQTITPPDPLQTVYRECIDGIKACISADGPFSFFQDPRSVADEMVVEAARINDAAAFAEYLPLADSHNVHVMCARTLMGDKAVEAELHKLLEAEQIGKLLYEAERQETEKPKAYYEPLQTPYNNQIMAACNTLGVSADVWIDTYAVDDDDRWYRRYLSRAYDLTRPGPNRDATTTQEAFDSHAAELADRSPELIRYSVPSMLEAVVDPAVRETLVSRYSDEIRRVKPTPQIIEDALQVGSAVLADPLLCTDERVTFFKSIWEHGVQVLRQNGHSYGRIVATVYRYTEAEMRHAGYPPEGVIKLIDAITTRSLKAGNHGSVAMQRHNERLSRAARGFAFDGNVAGAQEILRVMPPGEALRDAWTNCVQYVRTSADLEALQLDELALSADPALRMHHDIARMRIADDVDGLAAAMMQHLSEAHVPDTDNSQPDPALRNYHRVYAQAAYDAAVGLDRSRAPELAKQLVLAYRRLELPYDDMRQLVETLIAAGDTDEAQQSVAYINASYGSNMPGARAWALWDLARAVQRARKIQS